MTTQVHLVRHAKAKNRTEWTEPDDLRPLTKRGRREAVALADTTDHFKSRAYARLHLAATLARTDRDAEAASLSEEGLAIVEAKGDLTGLDMARRLLEGPTRAADV